METSATRSPPCGVSSSKSNLRSKLRLEGIHPKSTFEKPSGHATASMLVGSPLWLPLPPTIMEADDRRVLEDDFPFGDFLFHLVVAERVNHFLGVLFVGVQFLFANHYCLFCFVCKTRWFVCFFVRLFVVFFVRLVAFLFGQRD